MFLFVLPKKEKNSDKVWNGADFHRIGPENPIPIPWERSRSTAEKEDTQKACNARKRREANSLACPPSRSWSCAYVEWTNLAGLTDFQHELTRLHSIVLQNQKVTRVITNLICIVLFNDDSMCFTKSDYGAWTQIAMWNETLNGDIAIPLFWLVCWTDHNVNPKFRAFTARPHLWNECSLQVPLLQAPIHA